MAIRTLNFNLIKPAGEDLYNIEDFNNNFDIIDNQMKKNADGITIINKAGYQTAEDVLRAITQELGKLTKLDIQIVDVLPEKGVVGTIYFKPASKSETGNEYKEYIWLEANDKYEMIGTKIIDLSNYATLDDLKKYETKESANNKDKANVKLTGEQTIEGRKTFNESPEVPKPTENNQAANKQYVDDEVYKAASGGIDESDPTVPQYVKDIAKSQIQKWDGLESKIPKSTSQLTNDSSFITDEEVDTKISSAIATIDKLQKKIVTSIEDVKEENIIYMVPVSIREQNNYYDEYMFINNKPELLGTTKIDLSEYSTTSQMNKAISDAITALNISVENKKNTDKVKIVLSDTQPAEEEGVTTLWVDTSA